MTEEINEKTSALKNVTTQSAKLSLARSLYLKAQHIYMDSPINFSLFTGWKYPAIPRLLGNPLVGRLFYVLTEEGILQNLLSAGKLATNHPSGMCYYWLGNKVVLLVTKPEHVQHILITNNQNVSRRSITRFIEWFWGPNIISDPYELWKKKKAIYTNHLATTEALNKLESPMKAVVDNYLVKIAKSKQDLVNLQELLAKFSLDMTLNIVMPYDPVRDVEEYMEYMQLIGENVTNVKNIFKWSLPTIIRKILFRKGPKDLDQIKNEMREKFNALILAPHNDYIKNTDNFIKSIWELRKNEKNNSFLEENADVFGDGNALFFAAQDTVASTFNFIVKLLSANPAVENKLRAQLAEYPHGCEFSMETLNKIDYLEMVIKEALRLYPPSGFFPRAIDNAFKIDDLPLAKNSIILISPYLSHRQPDIWHEPEQFNPERFSKENFEKIPKHSYIPFGDGRHGCAGWRFAMQELKLLLAAIYSRYHVEVIDNDPSITFYRTTLRPKQTTMVRFIPIQ